MWLPKFNVDVCRTKTFADQDFPIKQGEPTRFVDLDNFVASMRHQRVHIHIVLAIVCIWSDSWKLLHVSLHAYVHISALKNYEFELKDVHLTEKCVKDEYFSLLIKYLLYKIYNLCFVNQKDLYGISLHRYLYVLSHYVTRWWCKCFVRLFY